MFEGCMKGLPADGIKTLYNIILTRIPDKTSTNYKYKISTVKLFMINL